MIYRNVFKVIYLFLTVWPLDPTAGSGATWEIAPPRTLVKFVGEDLFLQYEYNTPHYADPKCRFSLGYYVGGSTEDLLVRGDLDSSTGHIEVKEQLYPDRFSVTSYHGGFTFHVGNLGLSDSGQYLVDIRFSMYYYLHRAVVLTVYNRPQFMTTPSPDDIIAESGRNVTMSWTLSDIPSQPLIDHLQIIRVAQDGNYTLVDQRLLSDGSWSIRYPDEQLRFKRRISYAPGPNLESIDLRIRQLQPGDTGTYIVEIVYRNGVITLRGSVNLQVTIPHHIPIIHWISVPADPTYIAESSERTLNFTADFGNNTDLIPKYELWKMTSGGLRELLASMVLNENNTPEKIESIWDPDWTFSYNSSSSSVLVKISNSHMQDAGRYTYDLRNGSGETLAHYQFTIIILNDTSLGLEITPSVPDDDAISLKIQIHIFMFTPLIAVYDGNERGIPYACATTNSLEACIPLSKEQVLVVVTYESEDFHHKIQHPLNLSSLVRANNDQRISTAVPDIFHPSSTTPAMIDTQGITTEGVLMIVGGFALVELLSRSSGDMCFP